MKRSFVAGWGLAVLAAGAVAAAAPPDSERFDAWGFIRYTHRPASIYYAPIRAAAVVGVLSSNETVKADFRSGEWYAVFRVTEAERNPANAVGYMKAADLFPDPPEGEPACSPLVSIEEMETLRPPTRRASRDYASYRAAQPAPVAAVERAPGAAGRNFTERATFTLGRVSYRVARSWWADKLHDTRYPDQRPAGGAFLFVELNAQNESDQEEGVLPLQVVDAQGGEHAVRSGDWNLEGWMGALEKVGPKTNRTGFVVFDVPRGTYRLKITAGPGGQAGQPDAALVNLRPR